MSDVVGAVDCGTNSIRLLILDGVREVSRRMRIVRLGEGVDETGRLSPAAIERTRVALADYVDEMIAAGVTRVSMVATSATRDAANREDFFAMTATELGRVVPGAVARVVTGDEEAGLTFAGAVADLDADAGTVVVCDLGGGSTEIVAGSVAGVDVTSVRPGGATMTGGFSANIGCVRLTERFAFADPPTAEQIAAARDYARAAIAEALGVVDVSGASTWVGVAGTFTTIAALALGLDEYDSERIHLSSFPIADVEKVCHDLLGMTRAERLALGPMHPGRADVIGGGAVVVLELATALRERAGVDRLVVSEHDILDGIAASA